MNFVIIGGDAAGMSAAMQIVRNSEGHSITVFEQGGMTSYGQCGLPYVLSGDVESTEELIARKPETFRDKYGIDVRIYHEVTDVDCERKVVYGNDGKGERFELPYDRLLVASGASPVMPPWQGKDLKGIHTLKTIPDIKDIMAATAKDVEKVAIIGGGYIGLEMAEGFVSLGKKVRMIDRGSQLAKIFDEDMGELVHEEAMRNQMELHLDESVEGFKGKEHVEVVVTDKEEYDADLVLVAVGVTPNTTFMKHTGVYKGMNDAITVNAFMETSVLDIYAAGDCATQYHRIKKKDDYIPLGTHANKQGQIAGLNMINQKRSFRGIVGTSILKFFDITLARTGLSGREADQENIPYKQITIQSTHAAGYYSREDPMTLKIIYHEATGQLLGAQIIGGRGVDKRIDVLATALYHDMTIDELEDLDLSYAPPYNSVWDPIQQAARKAD
ncbi:NADPH-dependent 2,4-dienoyl-CoA reductase, sulfur reductase [Halobacillus karajensis]|uniref:Coenzyme A disulfide reductase n=1 Tax=Halobacillus karajensis TaxID=195088 RepID=A0A024P9S1_9BACI|nr:FAD-dependent oxidoreductase [Halobacillus karajensis]CDQ21552.1 Coenzyme A disulfide reductase [Halobacillus karajensis]CDQ25486.1 Coenzyme A disulfide reductase [Halobacillus karajensis]CDQ28983.1 Coenzyme A disulfide reductase [Halobacillus karajensis]SEI09054.1 NADPH-dependent 2,4-dienoyl-CoA reductase, sulfur reductase [Halobacillus karajensis]